MRACVWLEMGVGWEEGGEQLACVMTTLGRKQARQGIPRAENSSCSAIAAACREREGAGGGADGGQDSAVHEGA